MIDGEISEKRPNMVLIDLEKTCDRVPREKMWWALGRKTNNYMYIDAI